MGLTNVVLCEPSSIAADSCVKPRKHDAGETSKIWLVDVVWKQAVEYVASGVGGSTVRSIVNRRQDVGD